MRGKARVCWWITRIFGALHLVALALFLIGTFGLFGQPRDPLSGVFLIPLGLPWVVWMDGLPEAALPWCAALAPLLNISILALLCHLLRGAGGTKA